jgi:transposase
VSFKALLSDPKAIRLEYIRSSDQKITLIVRTARPTASCPNCNYASVRIHSRYERIVADLPWQGIEVEMQLHTRRFFCDQSNCRQRIFCERLPGVVASYARRTIRLNEALELVGFAIGGEVGARTVVELGMQVSPDTLIRRVRQATATQYCIPRVLGVDDWAFRRAKNYGTILVDLEKRRIIDL